MAPARNLFRGPTPAADACVVHRPPAAGECPDPEDQPAGSSRRSRSRKVSITAGSVGSCISRDSCAYHLLVETEQPCEIDGRRRHNDICVGAIDPLLERLSGSLRSNITLTATRLPTRAIASRKSPRPMRFSATPRRAQKSAPPEAPLVKRSPGWAAYRAAPPTGNAWSTSRAMSVSRDAHALTSDAV